MNHQGSYNNKNILDFQVNGEEKFIAVKQLYSYA